MWSAIQAPAASAHELPPCGAGPASARTQNAIRHTLPHSHDRRPALAPGRAARVARARAPLSGHRGPRAMDTRHDGMRAQPACSWRASPPGPPLPPNDARVLGRRPMNTLLVGGKTDLGGRVLIRRIVRGGPASTSAPAPEPKLPPGWSARQRAARPRPCAPTTHRRACQPEEEHRGARPAGVAPGEHPQVLGDQR